MCTIYKDLCGNCGKHVVELNTGIKQCKKKIDNPRADCGTFSTKARRGPPNTFCKANEGKKKDNGCVVM